MATDEQRRQDILNRVRREIALERVRGEVTRQRSPSEFATRSAAQFLGLPADITTGLKRLSGAETSDEFGEFLGSEHMAKGMRHIGIDVAPFDEKATTVGQQIAEGATDAASMLVPGLGAMSRISRLKSAPGVRGKVGQYASDVVETAKRRPGRFAADELAAGSGASVGMNQLSELGGDSNLAQFGLGIAGGFGGAYGGVKSLDLMSKYSPSALTVKGAKAAYAPFTESGATARVSNRLQDIVGDPAQVSEKLKQQTIADFTPAQASGEEGLLQLEKAVLNSDPKLTEQHKKRSLNNKMLLENELLKMRATGSLKDSLNTVEGRVNRLRDAVTVRAEQALDLAEQRVSKLAPKSYKTDISITARDEIEKAYNIAKKEEDGLWDLVPINAPVQPNATKAAYNNILQDLAIAEKGDVPSTKGLPDVIGSVLQGRKSSIVNESGQAFSSPTTVKELQKLRSKLLNISSDARKGETTNLNQARIADVVSDAILQDLSTLPDDSIQNALKYSRHLKQTFDQGQVGKIRRSGAYGYQKVAPELTLQSVIGKGGIKGSLAVDDLLKASDTPEMRGSVQEYLLDQISDNVITKGKVNIDKAEGFMASNSDLLQKFPEVQESLLGAVQTGKTSDFHNLRMDNIIKGLDSQNKSIAAKFIGGNFDNQFESILSSKEPVKGVRELMRMTSKDVSGDAMRGLQSGFFDSIYKKSLVYDNNTEGMVVSGKQLLQNLSNPKVRAVGSELLSKIEVERMQRISKELIALQRKPSSSSAELLTDKASESLSILGSMLGSRTGENVSNMMGGKNSLILQGRFANSSRRLLERLTGDKAQDMIRNAIFDKDALGVLLSKVDPKKPKSAEKFNRQLNAWQYSLVVRDIINTSNQPEQGE